MTMRKRIWILIAIVVMLCGCGSSENTYSELYSGNFEYAYIKMPDGSNILCKVKEWSRTSSGTLIFITTTDDIKYVVSPVNCMLVENPKSSEVRI